MTTVDYDVVIVGGGISGLMAARKLLEKKATDGSKILFVEALDRLGGRLLKLTQDVDRTPNNPVDVGACWICPEQPEVMKLAKEFGLTVVAQEDRGIRVHLNTQGGVSAWIGRLVGLVKWEEQERHSPLTKMPPADIMAYLSLGKKFEKMASDLIKDSEKPWEAHDAEKWDTMTCEEYLVAEVSNVAARGLMRSALLAIFCLLPTEYSMLWFLANLKAEGSFQMFTEGAQSHRVVEGNGSYTGILEKELKDAGVQFVLDTRVKTITQPDVSETTSPDDVVVITTDKDTTYKAKHAIVTIPPTEMKNITFTPGLPQAPYQAEMKMGKCIKTVLAYKERWWNGSFAFGDPLISSPITLVADVSNDNGNEAMLATFYYGANADKYTGTSNVDERKALSIKGAQNLLCDDPTKPNPKSGDEHVLSVVEGDWPSTPYIQGAYAAVANVGSITKTKMFHRALQKSFGLVHFCGTECAERWAGYIEGGIVTGRKAAEEVATALTK